MTATGKLETMGFYKNIVVIVAHPDDETLWCGGTMLLHPDCNWFVVCLSRKNDADRAPKFKKVLENLNANGVMGDLDDGPEQKPLNKETVEKAILEVFPKQKIDLIISHSPFGEYTRHLRHEEVGRAVITLWNEQKISTDALWLFAYEDGNKSYYPRAIEAADFCQELPDAIWNEKYRIINGLYGFEKSGFEVQTTPKSEAFWQFDKAEDALKFLEGNSPKQNL